MAEKIPKGKFKLQVASAYNVPGASTPE
ncbi:hypothetical protein RRG08_015726 [Elysia crispata]|uniref:Uncharacterized protein n=1 Tax=Elysia crispata TaxID=231223 RepID=A0AAE0Z5G9_9GAST|nr:hypothetical protein RRG08_015726 [Elysia crispata]